MASKTLTLNKLVSSDFSEGSSWVLNKGGGGDTDVGYFVFNSLGTSQPKISNVSFKINAIETGGNNLFSENIYLNFEFGKYDGTTFTKAGSFSFSQQGVKESQNQVSITASASSSSGSENVFGGNLCIKLTVTPQSNAIGSKIVMSGFSLSVTYEVATYTITAECSPKGAGKITGAGTYEYGASVKLNATAESGYKFSKWKDGVMSSERTVTVTGNVTYTAEFVVEKIKNIKINGVIPKTIYFDESNIVFVVDGDIPEFEPSLYDTVDGFHFRVQNTVPGGMTECKTVYLDGKKYWG